MLVKLAFVMQRLEKISKKIVVMINKDEGGGGQFLNFMVAQRAQEGLPVLPLGKTLHIPCITNFPNLDTIFCRLRWKILSET